MWFISEASVCWWGVQEETSTAIFCMLIEGKNNSDILDSSEHPKMSVSLLRLQQGFSS